MSAHTLPESLLLCCSTDNTRPTLLTPFLMVYEGARWAAATDGHLAAALTFDGDLRDDGPDLAALLKAEPAPTYMVRVTPLSVWAGTPYPAENICKACNGHPPRSYCPACGGGPRCDRCDGTGRWRESSRDGKMLGGALNRTLLSKAIATLPSGIEMVEVGHPEALHPYILRAPGWLAAIMPLRGANDDAPEFTSLLAIGSGQPRTSPAVLP